MLPILLLMLPGAEFTVTRASPEFTITRIESSKAAACACPKGGECTCGPGCDCYQPVTLKAAPSPKVKAAPVATPRPRAAPAGCANSQCGTMQQRRRGLFGRFR